MLAACSSPVEGRQQPEPVPAAAPSTPGNQFVPEQQRLLQAMLNRAEAERAGLSPMGQPAPILHAENTRFALLEPCGKTLSSDAKVGNAVQGYWFATDRTEDVNLHQIIADYPGLDTTTIVAEVARTLPCKPHNVEGGPPVRFAGQRQVAQAPGVRAQVAYCEDEVDLTMRDCYLVAALGERATVIDFTMFDKNHAKIENVLAERMNTLSPLLEAAIAQL